MPSGVGPNSKAQVILHDEAKRRLIAKLYRGGLPVEAFHIRFGIYPHTLYKILDMEGEKRRPEGGHGNRYQGEGS